MSKKGNLIILSGPSGTGKGTVCKELLASNKNIFYSISATTRSPRPHEKNGREYWFLSKAEFQELIKQNKLLEWAKVYDNYYGTPLEKVDLMREEGKTVLLEIDTQGALAVMQKAQDGIFIFLLPPSLQELSRRIRQRGTETPAVIKKRLAAAAKEIELGKKYHYLVINKTVADAVKKINAIILAENCLVKRNTKVLEKVMNEEI